MAVLLRHNKEFLRWGEKKNALTKTEITTAIAIIILGEFHSSDMLK